MTERIDYQRVIFQVTWGDEFAVNVLNPGHRSSGLITSLSRVGTTGSIVGSTISNTNQIPVEILVSLLL